MDDIKKIIEELNTLPKGYISVKNIHGGQYYYRQSLEGGKLQSYYVNENDVDHLRFELACRKALEEQLKEILSQGKDKPTPSKRSRELTGSLMSGNKQVAQFEQGMLLSMDEALCPLMIKRTGNLAEFLASRALDRGRTNSRILKKALGIHETEDCMVALHSYGACITDNYWFKAKGSKLRYEDIAFDQDYYSDIALKGELLFFPKSPKLSPQLTLTGSYEKCWKRVDGKWYLYKQGNDDEIFSELFCSALAKALEIPTAAYQFDSGYIKTENFAEGFNFEPMISIAGDDDSYGHVFKVLDALGPDFARAYIKLIWFDSIVNNVDRHNENCGLMRDKESGEILSLAPNFDNNLALIARSEVLNMDPSRDGFIGYFKKFLKENKKAKSYFAEMKMPELNESVVQACLDQIPIQRDSAAITRFILGRYQYLKGLL